MIGRAGRPQFDTLGVGASRRRLVSLVACRRLTPRLPEAVIMTEKGSESKYSDLVNAQVRHTRRIGLAKFSIRWPLTTLPFFRPS